MGFLQGACQKECALKKRSGRLVFVYLPETTAGTRGSAPLKCECYFNGVLLIMEFGLEKFRAGVVGKNPVVWAGYHNTNRKALLWGGVMVMGLLINLGNRNGSGRAGC